MLQQRILDLIAEYEQEAEAPAYREMSNALLLRSVAGELRLALDQKDPTSTDVMPKKYSSERTQLPVAQLTLPFSVIDGAFVMRQALGEVKLPDKTKVELSATLDGHIIVTITPPDEGIVRGWRIYSVSPDALIEAVLRAEGIYPDEEAFAETRSENVG